MSQSPLLLGVAVLLIALLSAGLVLTWIVSRRRLALLHRQMDVLVAHHTASALHEGSGLIATSRRREVSDGELEERIRERATELQLAAIIFDNASEGVLVTDADGIIDHVNPAFTTITGYTAEEAIGCKPNLLKSDHHSQEFYEQMWQQLLSTGRWKGEVWNRRKNGEAYPQHMSITALKDDKGTTVKYASIFTDITELKQSQDLFEYQAYHDALTGLPNRLLLGDRIDHALRRAARSEVGVAVLFLDLDDFKRVNDTLGHSSGDSLLQLASQRILESVREDDTVARIGGDEFVIVMEHYVHQREVTAVARRLVSTFGSPFVVNGTTLSLGISVGITVYPEDGVDADTLIKNADIAMYRAKASDKHAYCWYTTV